MVGVSLNRFPSSLGCRIASEFGGGGSLISIVWLSAGVLLSDVSKRFGLSGALRNEIVREAPPIVFRCASYPPHVLSIVDIYLAQPVIPRSSFYSPRAPKCLFRQD
jgi:hypothetical protein